MNNSSEDDRMPMNLVILEKRKALGLPQEQGADYLGASTPAVSEWEKGTTCPDIMLLYRSSSRSSGVSAMAEAPASRMVSTLPYPHATPMVGMPWALAPSTSKAVSPTIVT